MHLLVKARSEDCLRSLREVDLFGRLEAEGIVGRASAFSMASLTIPAVDDSSN